MFWKPSVSTDEKTMSEKTYGCGRDAWGLAWSSASPRTHESCWVPHLWVGPGHAPTGWLWPLPPSPAFLSPLTHLPLSSSGPLFSPWAFAPASSLASLPPVSASQPILTRPTLLAPVLGSLVAPERRPSPSAWPSRPRMVYALPNHPASPMLSFRHPKLVPATKHRYQDEVLCTMLGAHACTHTHAQ